MLDSGYQGANEYLPNGMIPYKATKKKPLTVEEKAFNTILSKLRIAIEHINRELKIFRICKETYRGKGERGLLRVKLIASLYNHRVVFAYMIYIKRIEVMIMSELTIKQFSMDLIDECVDLYMRTYSKEPWNESWDSRDVVANFYKNHCANNYFLGFVAMKNKRIVGVSVGFLKPWVKGMEYYIDDFFVSFDYQGQGIGSKFMKAIKNELILQNIHAIILSTERDYPAHKFYEKMGFSVLQDTIFLGVEF